MYSLRMQFSIYLITNTITGKRYVGATSQDVSRRWRQHIKAARSNDPKRACTALGKAIVKHGESAFLMKTLATVSTEAEMWRLEIETIAALRTTESDLGYNMSPGGDRGPPVTPETSRKAADARRGKPHTLENVAYRSPFISAAKKGKAPPIATILAAKAANTGRIHTPEQREKAAAAMRGLVRSAEHRAKLSAANLGKKLSAEHRAKVSEAGKGRVWSEESRAKLAATKHRQHSERRMLLELA